MRATRLLLRLAVTRWRNRLGFPRPFALTRAEKERFFAGRTSRRWKESGSGSGGDRSQSRIWLIFGPLLFLGSTLLLTAQIGEMRGQLETQDRSAVVSTDVAATPAPAVPAGDAARRVLALFLGVWFLGVLLTEFSNAGLETAGWDLEWLATLPVSVAEIARARLVTRTIVSPLGWLWLGPPGIAIAFLSDLPLVLAPIAGILAVVPLLFLCAVVVVFAEIGLHLFLRPGAVRNVKAVASLLAGLALFGVLRSNLLSADTPRFSGLLGAAVESSPFGLLVRIFVPRPGESAWRAVLLLLVEAGGIYLLAQALVGRIVRSGIVAGGSRAGTRRVALVRPAARPAQATPPSPLAPSPLLFREFKLLRRDMNYLMQAFLLPIALTAFQFGINLRTADSSRSVATLCAWGFGVSAYTYLQSALRTLVLERDSFWVLFTFPRPLSEFMRVKSQLYAAVGLGFALAFLAAGHSTFATFTWSDLAPLGLLLIGAPLFAFVMTAFGVISTRVLDVRTSKQASPVVIYSSMALIGVYTGTIASSDPWPAFGVLVLTLLLALALWQMASDRLPYLLDPDARIPKKLTLVHGIVALLIFSLAQQLLMGLVRHGFGAEAESARFISYSLAAILTSAIAASWLGSLDAPLLEFFRAARPRSAVALGLAVGLGCAVVGIAWRALVFHLGWVDGESLGRFVHGRGFPWFVALAVLAAPPCEELLFRGLVFQGLRRTFGLGRAALASGLLFAILHPVFGFPVILLFGLASAWLCARTGSLLASITAHAVYNLIVVGGAFLFV